MKKPTVLLGMSGGVDSSVAAALLVRDGYEVHGVTLQVWEHEDDSVAASKKWQERGCCKIGIARYVAQRLNISYEVVDERQNFRESVIKDFLDGYAGGITPNPCVRCNERVKLRGLIDLAEQRGIEYVATGHYVRVQECGGQYALHRALDKKRTRVISSIVSIPLGFPVCDFPLAACRRPMYGRRRRPLGFQSMN